MDKTSLGDRMKAYEKVTATKLMPRTATIIRVDGKAFHTLTKYITPELDPTSTAGFSELFHNTMITTALRMCRDMQNVCCAYVQSDEISFILRDWDKHTTQQWFGGKVQKMTSVSAAMTTYYFDRAWSAEFGQRPPRMAVFDSRVFQLPMEEVNNYMVWRQQDASRNSVQFIGRKHFSHKELHKKAGSQIQDKLMLEKGINWNDLPTWQKRGSCVAMVHDPFGRAKFQWDANIPIFTKNTNYINDQLQLGLGYE